MNIGIIGAGHVGKALAQGWLASGHRVMLGSRNLLNEKHQSWKHEAGEHVEIASFNKAASFGETIIIALPWPVLTDVLEGIEAAHFTNKTVIDVSNAVQWENGPRMMYEHTSAGEQVQKLLPQSFVVKALNTVSSSIMVQPTFQQGVPVMFISGNDAQAKGQVRSLLQDLGWPDIVDLGDIRHSRLQESIMVACVISEIQLNAPGSSFALLRQ